MKRRLELVSPSHLASLYVLLMYSEFITSPRNPSTDKFGITGNDNVKYRNTASGRWMGNTDFNP
jgi:hypothetical protein